MEGFTVVNNMLCMVYIASTVRVASYYLTNVTGLLPNSLQGVRYVCTCICICACITKAAACLLYKTKSLG